MSIRKIGALCALLIVFITGGAACAADGNSEETPVQSVDGVYQMSSPSEEDTIFRISFDAGTMTYVEDMIVGEQSYTVDSGSYHVEDGCIFTFSETDDAKSLEYVIDGDYILAKSFLYQGELPDGDTFEAVCAYEGNGVNYEIAFHEDGTYEEISRTTGGEDLEAADDMEPGVQTSGTYARDGSFLKRTDDTGEPLSDFYIYEGQITNFYYEIIRD